MCISIRIHTDSTETNTDRASAGMILSDGCIIYRVLVYKYKSWIGDPDRPAADRPAATHSVLILTLITSADSYKDIYCSLDYSITRYVLALCMPYLFTI